MQIKGKDAPDNARLGAGRAPNVGPLTPLREPGASTVSLALSRTGRMVSEALARLIPEGAGLRAGQLLTSGDHAMLALASELVDASGLPPEQLRKLVNDLAAYRLSLRSGNKPGGMLARREPATGSSLAGRAARPEAAGARGGFLTLRAFGVRDEALARDILRSPAVRTGVIDRGFVSALLDPDVGPAPTVDLDFLRRLAGGLQPASAQPAQPTAQVSTMLARREARGLLARALSALALPTGDLVEVTPDRATHGDALLRTRMPSLLDRLGAWLTTRTPSSASQAALPAGHDAIPTTGTDVTTPSWLAAGEASRGSRAAEARGARGARGSKPGAASPSAPRSRAEEPRASTPRTPEPAGGPRPELRDPLTRDDRSLLRLLYSAAAERGGDLRAVDEVAAALVAYRRAERADAALEGQSAPFAQLLRDQAASAAPGASIAPRARGEPHTYEAPRSVPPASLPPPAPGETRAYDASGTQPAQEHPPALRVPRGLLEAALRAPPAPSTEAALIAHDVPASARSYGSTTQMAARLANTYGRLAPSSVAPPPPSAPADYLARESATRAVAMLRDPSAALPFDPSMPLDLGYALGLGALFTEVQRVTARTRRQRRRRKRQQLMRAIGGLRHLTPASNEARAAREEKHPTRGRRSRARAR